MDGITKAATATFLKDKTNIYDKTNKSASETNRKEATLPNDTYPQSLSKEPTLIIQTETSDESAESIEIAEQSSDSNIPKKKESTTEKDVPIKSSQDDSVPDNSESKKSVKPTKSGESTADKAAKPSGTESGMSDCILRAIPSSNLLYPKNKSWLMVNRNSEDFFRLAIVSRKLQSVV